MKNIVNFLQHNQLQLKVTLRQIPRGVDLIKIDNEYQEAFKSPESEKMSKNANVPLIWTLSQAFEQKF